MTALRGLAPSRVYHSKESLHRNTCICSRPERSPLPGKKNILHIYTSALPKLISSGDTGSSPQMYFRGLDLGARKDNTESVFDSRSAIWAALPYSERFETNLHSIEAESYRFRLWAAQKRVSGSWRILVELIVFLPLGMFASSRQLIFLKGECFCVMAIDSKPT